MKNKELGCRLLSILMVLSSGLIVADDNVLSDGSDYKVTLTWDYSNESQAYISMSDTNRVGDVYRSIRHNSESINTLTYDCDQNLSTEGAPNNSTFLDNDILDNMELGLTTEPVDGLRVNASVYRVERANIKRQAKSNGVCGFNIDLAEITSTGLELELSADVNDYLTVNAGFGYTEAELSETVDQAGMEDAGLFLNVPELVWSISADWKQSLGSGKLFVYGSVSYVDDSLGILGLGRPDASGHNSDLDNANPEYTIVDVRVGYSSGGNWEAAIFVDNLTDENTAHPNDNTIEFSLPRYESSVRNHPRTIGVSASYSF